MKRFIAILLFAAVLAAGVWTTSAQAALRAVGPLNPANGFPLWYQDTNSLALAPCLDQNGFCLTSEPNPAAPISFPNNFGPEIFYWLADAAINTPEVDALLVLALEGTFGGIVGDQTVFARIRVRINPRLPIATNSTFTITHPFGQTTLTTRGLNQNTTTTQDIGIGVPISLQAAPQGGLALADDPLQAGTVNADGRSIGPFLTRADGTTVADPLDPTKVYLSNPNIPTAVTGSPFGTNFFRIVGPGVNQTQNLFTLMGKIAVIAPPPVTRAEFKPRIGKWTVTGTGATPTDVVTIRRTNAAGPVIGTATVAADGTWSFTGKAKVSPGAAPRTLFISSPGVGVPPAGGLNLTVPFILR